MIWKLKLAGIGFALVSLAVGGYVKGCNDRERDRPQFISMRVNDRQGFRLVLPQRVWKAIAKRANEISLHPENQASHAVDAMVEQGIAALHIPDCSHQWVMTRIDGALEDETVSVEGICATPAEIQAAKFNNDKET